MPVDAVALRACTINDADALALVACATFLDAYAGFIDGQAIIAFCKKHHTPSIYAEALSQPKTRAWLAELGPGAAPVGYSLLTTPDLPLADLAASDIELKRIYLLSRLHGSGAGQRLMNAAITSALGAGEERMLIGVHRENARALSFYARNGFQPVGARRFEVGNKIYDDLILGRNLL